MNKAPTFRLLAGLAITLAAVAIYSGYTVFQIRALREMQRTTIDRNRADSLLLLRIQNDLNSIGIAMRDMLDANEPYPLGAWKGQFKRIRQDLDDALSREQTQASGPASDQRHAFTSALAQFWDALDRVFALANDEREEEARTQIRLSLQARQASLTGAVSRLLVHDNESEQESASRTRDIYARVERNVYVFLVAMLFLIAVTTLVLVQHNRNVFGRVAALSERRSELAQQLISMQENTFRSISRELHDDFGQILTAVGAMLQRASRLAGGSSAALLAELDEVREIVQATLERIRSLSQALHPVVLDEAGLESALENYLPAFERRTGIEIRYERPPDGREVDQKVSIHFYRIVQEALNNVARHSKSTRATVRLRFEPRDIVLEIEDEGVGFGSRAQRHGMGLISMRERADLVRGKIEFMDRESGGALVRLTAPAALEELHAGS